MKGQAPFLFIMCVMVGCGSYQKEDSPKEEKEKVYKNIFGNEYLASGEFLKNNKDSVEIKLWQFTYLSPAMVLFGNYTDGILTGKWNFVLDDKRMLTSNWTIYQNSVIPCKFSLPFVCTDTLMNPYVFKLTTINDSLGQVSIVVGVSDTLIKDQDMEKYGFYSEAKLHKQGYEFTSARRNFKKGELKYFFAEYFMKDATGKSAKLYNVYGYTPSKKHFIQFTLFHSGPNDDLVKIIYNLMVESMYVDDERFINPYIVDNH